MTVKQSVKGNKSLESLEKKNLITLRKLHKMTYWKISRPPSRRKERYITIISGHCFSNVWIHQLIVYGILGFAPIFLLKSLFTVCDFHEGELVKDDSYPLYKPGSCNLIDEQFTCVTNGSPDVEFQKLKWKPKQCILPRLNGGKLLEMITERRLAFVGDSLNMNMWESLVCILKGSVKVKSQIFEAHGRHQFCWEAEYSFVFKLSFFQQSTICFITC
ncbi:hypothetical protein Bca4012_101747 [Brassica carinata]|uniref:(rape) hypothetical protein n=1 Tax=Brassica napus TaxID=3708 RepID=A0A816QUP3_BRANA|nr:unnamed protein product [Brassica napus]